MKASVSDRFRRLGDATSTYTFVGATTRCGCLRELLSHLRSRSASRGRSGIWDEGPLLHKGAGYQRFNICDIPPRE